MARRVTRGVDPGSTDDAGVERKRCKSDRENDLMVTLTNVQGEVAVDTAAGESVGSEQLLAQVLDDDTVAALA